MTIYGSLNIRWLSCTPMCHWLRDITLSSNEMTFCSDNNISTYFAQTIIYPGKAGTVSYNGIEFHTPSKSSLFCSTKVETPLLYHLYQSCDNRTVQWLWRSVRVVCLMAFYSENFEDLRRTLHTAMKGMSTAFVTATAEDTKRCYPFLV